MELAPRLRSDIDCRRQTTSAGEVYIVKDPVRGDYFRMQSAEGFILAQLDGSASLDEIRQRTEEKFSVRLEKRTLEAFITKLDESCLLDTERGRRVQEKYRASRAEGGLLSYRIKLVNPERFLNSLVRYTAPIFSHAFVQLSTCVILLGVMIALFNWDAIIADSAQLVRWSILPLLLVTIFVVVSLHEIAHGLVCKHFGGEVREMGFMLLYFQPAFYCNVSDAWLFQEKYKRLWVGFAGPYFELVLWAVALMAWRVTSPETWISQVALVIFAISGIRSLLNFNPLIKLDGYYLLSDFLDMPNLRKRAFRYVGDCLRRLVRLGELPKVTRRERKIFIAYGATAWIFSVSLLTYIGLFVGEYLVIEQQRVAFLALTGLISFRLRDKIHNLFGKRSKPSRSAPQSSASKRSSPSPSSRSTSPSSSSSSPSASSSRSSSSQRSPSSSRSKSLSSDSQHMSSSSPSSSQSASSSTGTDDRDHGEKYRKRGTGRKRRWMFRAVFGSGIAVLLIFGQLELRVAGDVIVLPQHNADVRAEIDGTISEILVDEGQFVEKGELVARLSDREHRADLRKTEAEIMQVRARLNQLTAGATRWEIDVARSAVATAEDTLRFAVAKRSRQERLHDQELISRDEFDETLEQEIAARNRLAEARSRLEVLLAGTRPEEIDAAEAEFDRLSAQKEYIEGQLDRVNVLSPAGGIVTTPRRQLRALVRQAISKGDLIATIHDFNVVTLEAAISEKEIADVQVGQTVGVKTRAYPDRIFYGKVVAIAPTTQGGASSDASASAPSAQEGGSSGSGRSTTVRVVTEINNSEGLLKPGMTGMAKIYCGERRVFELMLRRLSRTVRVEFWSWW